MKLASPSPVKAAPTLTPIQQLITVAGITPSHVDRAFGMAFDRVGEDSEEMFAAIRTLDGQSYSLVATILADGTVVNDLFFDPTTGKKLSKPLFAHGPHVNSRSTSQTFDEVLNAITSAPIGVGDAAKAVQLIDKASGRLHSAQLADNASYIEIQGPAGADARVVSEDELAASSQHGNIKAIFEMRGIVLETHARGTEPTPIRG